jgi:acyl carrier protein
MPPKLKLPPPLTLSLDEVRQAIAEILKMQMDIEPHRSLADTPFMALHDEFDSLSMMELQLLLEEKLHFELDFKMHSKLTVLPTNVTELSQEVLRQYSAHMAQLRPTSETQPAPRALTTTMAD